MTAHGEILVAVYMGQGLLALVLSAYFFIFIQDYQRPYLRHWGYSYLAMAIHMVLAATAFVLLVRGVSPGLRVWVSAASLAAVYAQVALLFAGVLSLAWQRPLTERRVILSVAGFALLGASTGLIAAFDPEAAVVRALTRLGVKNLLLALVFLAAAWVILRHSRASATSGGRFLAGLMTVYALVLLHDLSIQSLAILDHWRAPYLSLIPLSDLVLHAMIGVGLVTWLFQQEREVAETARDQASQLSLYDPLTGLPNRNNVRQHLAEQIHTLGGTGLKVAFAFVDLDRFRRINDSLGHRYGDELLILLGQRLQDRSPPGIAVSRIGSDEFAFVLSELRGEDEARARLAYLMDLVREPLHVAGRDIHLEYSCGFALFPDDGEDEQTLMRAADLAHSTARKKKTGELLRYQTGMEEDAGHSLVMETELRRALSDDQFRVHYQPMMNQEGELAGVEALVRWQHPERGLLGPDQFLPLVDTIGLSSQLDYWVLEAACRQLSVWSQQGLDLKMAVNLSARLFEQPELPSTVERVVRRTGIRPSILQLEITEQVAMNDIEAGNAAIQRLHEVGVSLALDDFGTGYSSMSWLRRLPVDQVKIDKSFISELDTPQGRAIVRSMTELARALGLKVTAEGVETRAQWDELRTLRCDNYQGFYFSRPLRAQDLLAFWKKPPFRY